MTHPTDPTDPTDPTGTTDPHAPHAPEPSTDAPHPTDTADALRSVGGESAASAIGSFMAGIEQQVFQRRPPAIELVQEAQPVRGISGDGLEITISLPEPSASER
jgi:hypothetical protein